MLKFHVTFEFYPPRSLPAVTTPRQESALLPSAPSALRCLLFRARSLLLGPVHAPRIIHKLVRIPRSCLDIPILGLASEATVPTLGRSREAMRISEKIIHFYRNPFVFPRCQSSTGKHEFLEAVALTEDDAGNGLLGGNDRDFL